MSTSTAAIVSGKHETFTATGRMHNLVPAREPVVVTFRDASLQATDFIIEPELPQKGFEKSGPQPLPGMVGTSASIREVYDITRKVARATTTVLLTGETGTGKELIARALHELSPRADGPFVRVNCGALSETLLESELFGHRRGAFSGAFENRTGRFEAAHGGTIFLDEINSLSFSLQVKLLRVLQEHELERVGDSNTLRVDVRVIAATNMDLSEAVRQGVFREDLYYRLNVIPIKLPPLRERREDIDALALSFARRYAFANSFSAPLISSEALQLMRSYHWPGNVRELQNYIERALVLSDDGIITAELLPAEIRESEQHVTKQKPAVVQVSADLQEMCQTLVALSRRRSMADSRSMFDDLVGTVEKELIQQVLRENFGVKSRTSQRLGINRNTLQKKIREYDLETECR